MAAKVNRIGDRQGNHHGYTFYCPGCEGYHMFQTEPWARPRPGGLSEPGPVWKFNGNVERPTFNPSLLVYEGKRTDTGEIYQPRCHSFVRDGKIQYLGDCGHPLAGQTVDLLDVDTEPF